MDNRHGVEGTARMSTRRSHHLTDTSLLFGAVAMRAFAADRPVMGASLALLTATSMVHHGSYESADDFQRMQATQPFLRRADHAAIGIVALGTAAEVLTRPPPPRARWVAAAAFGAVALLYACEREVWAPTDTSATISAEDWETACRLHAASHVAAAVGFAALTAP